MKKKKKAAGLMGTAEGLTGTGMMMDGWIFWAWALPKIWNIAKWIFFSFIAINLDMDFPPLGQESGVSKVYSTCCMYSTVLPSLKKKNHCIRRSMSPDTPGRPAAAPSGSSIVALLMAAMLMHFTCSCGYTPSAVSTAAASVAPCFHAMPRFTLDGSVLPFQVAGFTWSLLVKIWVNMYLIIGVCAKNMGKYVLY